MEMNTRLQVEHPVTEAVTGLDLVRQQLLRRRRRAGSRRPAARRCAGTRVEFRLNAEDPSRGFMPSPGTVTRFRPPLGPGVRVDTHVVEGYRVPPNYDSLVAKLVVWDADRARRARPRRAARCGELEIEGIRTTRELFLDIVDEPLFRSGVYTTGYLQDAADRLPSLQRMSSRPARGPSRRQARRAAMMLLYQRS